MTDDNEESYAARIGRNMWRAAKRRARSLLELRAETAGAAHAAFPAAPETKSWRPPAPVARANPAPAEPATLREFLQRLGEELGTDDKGPDRS